MSKEKFALMALCTACASAHAQSSVTLYGVVDTAVEYVTHVAGSTPTLNAATGTVTQPPGGSKASLISNGGVAGSRWGIRGIEDLGGGTQALFVLESGFGPDTGTSQQGSRLFGRQAFVGLKKAGFGQVMFGRQYTSFYETLVAHMPNYGAPLYEPATVLSGQASREDNTIKYIFDAGGFTARAHWSFGAGAPSFGLTSLNAEGAGEVPGHFRDNTAYGFALTYSSGPFSAAMAYDQWNPAQTTGNAGSAKRAGVAGDYTFGRTTLYAGYRWANGQTAMGTAVQRDDLYWVGANYQATTALALKVGYYYNNIRALQLAAPGPVTHPANPWQVAFMAGYSLSKRTDLYLALGYVKNAGLNFDTAASRYAFGYPLAQGANSQFGVGAGIRHIF